MKYKAVLLFIVVLGVLVALSAQAPPQVKTGTTAPAITKEPAVDPSSDWLSKYDELLALQKVIQQIRSENGLDKLESKLNSEAMDLQKQIPSGYTFNPQTKKFDKLPEPPTPPKYEAAPAKKP